MSIKRKRNVSVECAVSAFHSEVKLGPDYVCTCIATHQIAEWGTCANQLTPRVLHLGALVSGGGPLSDLTLCLLHGPSYG